MDPPVSHTFLPSGPSRYRNFRYVLLGCRSLYIDLRQEQSHLLLADAPYNGFWRELDEVAVIKGVIKEGDIAFDIGANIGLHSILLSNLLGPSGRLLHLNPIRNWFGTKAYGLRSREFRVVYLGPFR